MIVSLHHVQITIPKGAEDEGRKFYCELLGLPEITKPAPLQGRGGFWLQVGDLQVHVGTEEGVDHHATKAHVAYAIDDLEQLRQRLREAGVLTDTMIDVPQRARFEIRDPFGNRIEFTTPEQW